MEKGDAMKFKVCSGSSVRSVKGWASASELVCHTDADLAMALQLADLLGQDYAQATFNSHDLCVMARGDWHVPEAEWLRDQVEQELLNRGAR